MALARAKSPRSGDAELEELRCVVDAATSLSGDSALMRAARELLDRPGSAGSTLQRAAEMQLSRTLIRAKSPRSGRAELAELERVLDTARAARLTGALMREAQELVAQRTLPTRPMAVRGQGRPASTTSNW